MSLPTVSAETTGVIRPRQKFEGHANAVYGVIHLPDGRRIMTCSDDGSLRMWNLKSGKQIGNDWRDGDWRENKSGEWAIALSPDGKQVVNGSEDGAVKLWNIDTGKIIAKWKGNADGVRFVRWTQDGGRVLSGSSDGTPRVWDVERGETILEIEAGLMMCPAIYSPDESTIATGGHSDRKDHIKIFDAKTGKLVANLKGHKWPVNCLAWTPDGTTLISGSNDHSIRTWNTTTWQQINVLTGHTSTVWDIAISPNGRILASASFDHTARLWNLENGQPIASPLQHSDHVGCVSFSTDGKLLATGCVDKNAYTWDITTILREAGLDDLLLNPYDGHKSLLEADAARRPGQGRRRDNIDPNRPLPPGFFDDSPRHPPPFTRPAISSAAARQHVVGHRSSDRRGIPDRLSSIFRRNNYNAHDTTSRPRLLEGVSNPFSRTPRRRHHEGIDLQEHRPTVVDVPFTRGNPRNVSAAQVRAKKDRERAKKAKKSKRAKNACSSSSQPPQGSTTQQSGGAAQAQSHTEPHAAVGTPDVAATSAVTTLTTSIPDAIIPRAGCWTRFRLFICCFSAQYTDGHH